MALAHAQYRRAHQRPAVQPFTPLLCRKRSIITGRGTFPCLSSSAHRAALSVRFVTAGAGPATYGESVRQRGCMGIISRRVGMAGATVVVEIERAVRFDDRHPVA